MFQIFNVSGVWMVGFQTPLYLNNWKFSSPFRRHSICQLFSEHTLFYILNARLVKYLDPHCITKVVSYALKYKFGHFVLKLFAKKILNRQPSAIGFQPLSFCIGKLFSLREETDFRSEKNTKETVCF